MAQRRVLGVSLGSPGRDFRALWTWEGGTVEIRRLGTGGDVERARRLLEQYDGQVDAFGLGGVNVSLQARGRRYRLPLGERLSSVPRHTPVCDGTFVKAWWEPRSLRVACEEGGLNLAGRAVLFSSVLDRWPLAQALEEAGARVLVGDAAFALRIPVLFPGLRWFYPFAVTLVPLLRHLPLAFLYPQARRHQPYAGGRLRAWVGAGVYWRPFHGAEVLAGDLHFFRRRLPPRLDNRWVIGSGLDGADLALLAERGVSLVIELEPVVHAWRDALVSVRQAWSDEPVPAQEAGGAGQGRRGLSANLAEAVVVAASGRAACDLGAEGMRTWCRRLGFRPSVYRFPVSQAEAGMPVLRGVDCWNSR
ncbi:MAG: hypothetical protein AB1816_15565 [Bacillota bacterium]